MSDSDRPRALVTGATSGIGAAFARRLAGDGYDLVLVARDAERLDATAAGLTAAHGGAAATIVADLSTPEGVAKVAEFIAVEPLDLVVNNAGMSINRAFLRSTPELEEKLLALNVTAVMRLTLAATQAMIARGRGGVINVSSVSGFAAVMPGSTYPASKAWVTAFTESVGLSARQFGVRVMALCPGYTRTEFHSRAGINMSKTPPFMWLDPDPVVRAALRDFRRGKLVSVPTWRYKIATFGMRHAPRTLLQRVAKDTRGRIGRDQ